MSNKLETPVLKSPPKTPVVTKVYPGSKDIGKGASAHGGLIDGPAGKK